MDQVFFSLPSVLLVALWAFLLWREQRSHRVTKKHLAAMEKDRDAGIAEIDKLISIAENIKQQFHDYKLSCRAHDQLRRDHGNQDLHTLIHNANEVVKHAPSVGRLDLLFKRDLVVFDGDATERALDSEGLQVVVFGSGARVIVRHAEGWTELETPDVYNMVFRDGVVIGTAEHRDGARLTFAPVAVPKSAVQVARATRKLEV